MSRTRLLQMVTVEINRRVPTNAKVPAFFARRFQDNHPAAVADAAAAAAADDAILQDVRIGSLLA